MFNMILIIVEYLFDKKAKVVPGKGIRKKARAN